jgi:hypothetical protein
MQRWKGSHDEVRKRKKKEEEDEEEEEEEEEEEDDEEEEGRCCCCPLKPSRQFKNISKSRFQTTDIFDSCLRRRGSRQETLTDAP